MASAYPAASPGGPHAQHGPGGGSGGGGDPREAVPDSYFTESRKGEVNELKNLLRNFSAERDPKRKRDIIKKVIAYMTLGIDVSRLFSEMMLAIETRDLVIKKMVYLYLCNYARTHPELAQMCTNTLQKDCSNDDPMVRGLALRALCSLNLPEMVEYISEPLGRSLTDGHAYVRKTGVMGILKLYRLDQEAFERCNFVDILYDMLKDPDASVVTNCIIVLNEVMAKSPNGGMAINRAIMLHLLNRIHEFSEFAVVQVLNLVPRYIPANEEEGYQIMNLLDPVIGRSSSGAVMATVNAFISIAEHIGQTDESTDPASMKRQIVSRVKAPLVTLVSAASPELAYTLLKHLEALIDMCPNIFDDEYRQFYIRYNDPTHIKNLKVTILPKLANPDTAPDIVAELAEYVNDTNNIKLNRLAVRSMTRIACRDVGGPGCAESITRRLVEMLDLNVDHVCSEAATALTHVIRKHPSLKSVMAPSLSRSLKYMKEPSGKASIVFLLGECADIVKDAPYALEKFIQTYDDLSDATVKIALLSATMKVFFVRPPETQQMLGRLLAKATDDVSSQDLHDRALFYYRMLKSGTDPQTIQNVIVTKAAPATNNPTATRFAEEDDVQLRDQLLKEFDTLATIFAKPSVHFIAEEYQVKYAKMPQEHPLGSSTATTSTTTTPLDTTTTTATTTTTTPVAPAAPAASTDVVDLLGFGDDTATSTPAPAPAPAQTPSSSVSSNTFTLDPSVTMTGEEYQNKWSQLDDANAIVTTLGLNALPSSTQEFETKLAKKHIMTMASGELPTEFKFFLFGREVSTGNNNPIVFLIQSNLSKTTPDEPLLILTIKLFSDVPMDESAKQQKQNQLLQCIGTSLAEG